MDYKELIENQDFSSPAKVADWIWNATCAITDLLAHAEAAEARAEKAQMERDAAVKDLKDEVMGKIWACDYCKKNDPEDFRCKRDDLCGCSEWEWRGQKEG